MYDKYKQLYTLKSLSDFADCLRVITGKFDIDELNKIINVVGYIGVFYNKIKEMEDTNLCIP